MIVHADIKNIADYVKNKCGYIVARRAEEDAKLWFYGIYSTEERAREVAIEIKNGVVLERKGGV